MRVRRVVWAAGLILCGAAQAHDDWPPDTSGAATESGLPWLGVALGYSRSATTGAGVDADEVGGFAVSFVAYDESRLVGVHGGYLDLGDFDRPESGVHIGAAVSNLGLLVGLPLDERLVIYGDGGIEFNDMSTSSPACAAAGARCESGQGVALFYGAVLMWRPIPILGVGARWTRHKLEADPGDGSFRDVPMDVDTLTFELELSVLQ